MSKIKPVRYKGDKEGYCNLCKKHSILRRDHIPPQGCVKPTRLELRNFSHYFSDSNQKPTVSQSGLNFYSICDDCNTKLLGSRYDPVLIHLTRKIAVFVKTQRELRLSLPSTVKFGTKPHRLIRAVIGHILAGKLPKQGTPPISAPYPDALREYFFDTSKQLPSDLKVYYWIFPSDYQIVINNLGIGSAIGEDSISSSCLIKFFPLAFWLVWKKPDSFPIPVREIHLGNSSGLDSTCDLVFDLYKIPPLLYPERWSVEDRYFTIDDEASCIARPKKPKGFG